MELDEDRVHKMGNDEGSGDGFQNLSDGEVEVNSDQVTEGLNLADGDVVNGLPEEKASVVGDVEKKKVVRKGLFKSTARQISPGFFYSFTLVFLIFNGYGLYIY
ncbi:unnamed protein product [Brassica rapa subsp. narinosa]